MDAARSFRDLYVYQAGREAAFSRHSERSRGIPWLNLSVIPRDSSRHTVLYTRVTNSLERRASEHSLGSGSAFAQQYNAHKLIYFEAYPDPTSAIAREKQLKRWRRAKKEELIAKRNPEWRDLFSEMYALRKIGGDR